jgi:hypothetical protein
MERPRHLIGTLILGSLTGACQPWSWPGDLGAARRLAESAEIQQADPLMVRVEGDLALRFRPQASPHPDGPALLVAQRCDGRLDTHTGPALSLWLPDGACVAQIDQRPNGGRWLTMRNVLPLTRVYADPVADPAKVLANLRDNAPFAADAIGGSLTGCTKRGPHDLLCTIQWGGCLVMDDPFYFRVRPRPRGGTYVIVEVGDYPEEGTEWWQAEIATIETSAPPRTRH